MVFNNSVILQYGIVSTTVTLPVAYIKYYSIAVLTNVDYTKNYAFNTVVNSNKHLTGFTLTNHNSGGDVGTYICNYICIGS